jgi:type III secretory pathway component EscR
MPDGRMLVCYTQFRNDDEDDTTQEWVVALHADFTYDYETDVIYTLETQEVDIEEFMELADTLEQRVKPLKTFGKFYNNTEAQQFFNQNGKLMLQSVQHMKLKVIEFYPEY